METVCIPDTVKFFYMKGSILESAASYADFQGKNGGFVLLCYDDLAQRHLPYKWVRNLPNSNHVPFHSLAVSNENEILICVEDKKSPVPCCQWVIAQFEEPYPF